jgi:hypothetical protein
MFGFQIVEEKIQRQLNAKKIQNQRESRESRESREKRRGFFCVFRVDFALFA